MAPMKRQRPIPPDLGAKPDQDLEGLGGPELSGVPDQDLEGIGSPDMRQPPEQDLEGLAPTDEADRLDSTHRTPRSVRHKAGEMGLTNREDDDALDTDDAYRTEAYDSGLGQDPAEPGIEPGQEGEATDGADTRSR